MKVLIGYGRKSRADSADVASLQRQRASVDKIATDQGLRLEWYQDHDLSGFYEDSRLEWQKVLNRLADPDVAGVAAETLDRLYRNVGDFQRFNARLDALGKFVLDLQAALGELEYRVASERQRRAARDLKYNKGQHIGSIPFGCDRDRHTKHLIPTCRYYYFNPDSEATVPGPVPDEVTGEIETPNPPVGYEVRYYHDALRELFTLYSSAELSATDTANALHQAGWYFWDSSHSIPKPFNAMNVDSITRRAHIYAGQIEPGQPGAHDPILPVELCQAVRQAKLVRRNVKSKGPRNKAHRVFLLSGIVYCGRCGRKLCGQGQPHFKTRERISYYRHMYNKQGCTERDVFAVDIESAALEALTRIDRDALAGDLAGDIQALFRQAALIDSQSDLEKLDSKQAEVERLIDLYQTGVITKDQLIARKAPLDSEIDELKNRVEITSLGTLADVEAIVNEVVDSLGKLHEASPELQKTILHSLIERIDIAGQRITGITPLPWAKPFFKFWLMSSRPRPVPA